MAERDLRRMFAPRGIALVGATEDSLWARQVAGNLSAYGYPGPVVVVHPHRDAVLGLPTVRRLADVDAPIDLAYVLTGSGAVPSVVEDMAHAGVAHGIVLASGYAESGVDGLGAQRRLAERARELGVSLLGPNSMGFVNPLTATAPFGSGQATPPAAGRLAIVMQSGALSGGILAFMRDHGIGLSLLVSTGNEAVVGTVDLIDHVVAEGSSRAVALFLEHVPDPARLGAAVARANAAGIAVVALTVGRSEAGKRAAFAHTGALAGDAAVTSAALRRAGIIETRSLEELITTAALLAHLPQRPRGPRIAAVTASGGAADIVADRATDVGLSLPTPSAAVDAALRAELPPYASFGNPVDVTGYESPRRLANHTRAIDEAMAILAGDDIDAVLAVLSLPAGEPDSVQRRLAGLSRMIAEAPVPVVLSTYTCIALNDTQRARLAEHGLLFLGGIDLAVTALAHAVRWSALVADAARPREVSPAVTADAQGRGRPAPTTRDGLWNEADGRDLVAACGVGLPAAELARDVDEAVAAARRLGWPVVLKVCSSALPHKSDVGGVRLGLSTEDDVAEAYRGILAAVAEHAPDAVIDGVLVAAMRPPGVELVAGVHVDAQFGPVLTVGLGGVWVEVLDDVVHRLLPVDATDVAEMLAELRGARILSGARGSEPVDRQALVRTILGLATAAERLGPALGEIELNPIRATATGAEALDVLVATRAVPSRND